MTKFTVILMSCNTIYVEIKFSLNSPFKLCSLEIELKTSPISFIQRCINICFFRVLYKLRMPKVFKLVRNVIHMIMNVAHVIRNVTHRSRKVLYWKMMVIKAVNKHQNHSMGDICEFFLKCQ